MRLQKIQAIISRCQNHPPVSQLRRLLQFQLDRIDQGLHAHRLYNARGTQNGYTSLNSQHGIEGFFCNFPALRNKDPDTGSALVIQLLKKVFCRLLDHLPGNGIDGRLADLLIQTRFGHPANPFSAIDLYPLFLCQKNLGID